MEDLKAFEKVRKIIETKSAWQKMKRWRMFAIALLVFFLITLGLFNNRLYSGYFDYDYVGYFDDTYTEVKIAQQDHIAQIEINGFVFDNQPLIQLLDEIEKQNAVKALLIKVNTAGGSVVGAEIIFNKISRIAKKKPVAVSIGHVAASAGYLISTAADKIYAHKTSIVGSIGVIVQWVEFKELLNNIGIEPYAVRSAPYKALPNPLEKTPEYVIENLQESVAEIYDWFVEIVVERRNMKKQDVIELADGRVFSGMRAVRNGLIDEIGGVDEIVKWLENEKKLQKELKIFSYDPGSEELYGLLSNSKITKYLPVIEEVLENFGVTDKTLSQIFSKGAVSIWRPGKQ